MIFLNWYRRMASLIQDWSKLAEVSLQADLKDFCQKKGFLLPVMELLQPHFCAGQLLNVFRYDCYAPELRGLVPNVFDMMILISNISDQRPGNQKQRSN